MVDSGMYKQQRSVYYYYYYSSNPMAEAKKTQVESLASNITTKVVVVIPSVLDTPTRTPERTANAAFYMKGLRMELEVAVAVYLTLT